MHHHMRKVSGITLLTLAAVWIVAPACAQTNQSISFGTNLGALHYEMTSVARTCFSNGFGTISYKIVTFSNFNYVSSQNTSQPIGGSTYWDVGIGNRLIGSGNCPRDISGGVITYNGSTYTITMTPHSNGTLSTAISVQGYINPKYVVLGVTYAPPGPQSFVDYTNSTLVSNTSSLSSSFSTGFTYSTKITTGAGVPGVFSGSITSTTSTSYAQEATSSSSVTVSKAASLSQKVPGPASPYVGLDHDFDVIWVWLNPVAFFTLTPGMVQWNGYGYNTADQPAMDVIGVFVGCLNGNLSQVSCNSQYQAAFARSWAANETWPSGQGPGLTAADLQNILDTDPYGRCSSTSAIGSGTCPNPDPTRFTLTLDQSIQYQQPPPGGQPFTIGYMESYTNTSSQAMGATYMFSQSYGLEVAYSVGGAKEVFGFGYNGTISQSQTLTWKNEWNSQITSSTTSTAQASITGPTCNVVASACSPVYPPSSPTYGQAIAFDVYQDSLYGTFLLIPRSY